LREHLQFGRSYITPRRFEEPVMALDISNDSMAESVLKLKNPRRWMEPSTQAIPHQNAWQSIGIRGQDGMMVKRTGRDEAR
jgi:hypothetical protein